MPDVKIPGTLLELHREFMADLLFCCNEVSDTLKQIESSIQLCDVYRSRLYGYYRENKFENQVEEVHFFKVVKPMFLSELEYFARLQQFQLFGFETLAFCKREHLRMKRILEANKGFAEYYKRGVTYFDEAWFTRGTPAQTTLSILPLEAAGKFTSVQDGSVSGLLAINRYLLCLEEKIKFLS
ncbi:hypothetical protein GWC95_15485 [Sediminibacterium roseum]|uniref:RteC protein n=1 Tax=Sediminibacterium roseum TaxID=1978412 RepID=A0ABW9ZXU6_9BACT|nr:RteC domain-containing protein [Sediminibacterium roseum]NCI51330.1 hypothetical protein [Sediminibacterium roseum]